MSTTLLHDISPPSSETPLNVCPFEGPEKLLEVWFAPSVDEVRREDDPIDDKGVRRSGLRKVKREEWEEMLAIVKCQVLSVVEGREIDAYLLSESSLFVSPHRIILKTCGTTLNLLGLPRILAIAAEGSCNLPNIHRLFYSRKSFMFPERQQGPHREWKEEVAFLDNMFGRPGKVQEGGERRGAGSAYTVGSVNRDHWLLYMTGPEDNEEDDDLLDGAYEELQARSDGDENASTASGSVSPTSPPLDFTFEILMSKLSASGRRPFLFNDPADDSMSSSIHDSACSVSSEKHDDVEKVEEELHLPSIEGPTPHHTRGLALSQSLGITDLFPSSRTTLDAFAFEPCGYSANALVRTDHNNEGYYTIHVTPEEGWSYASFECNVSLPLTTTDEGEMPDLQTLIQRVVKIFQPGHITLTLFVSTPTANETCPVDAAQATFHKALAGLKEELGWEYKRTDKINYEFCGYDLAFASFQRKMNFKGRKS